MWGGMRRGRHFSAYMPAVSGGGGDGVGHDLVHELRAQRPRVPEPAHLRAPPPRPARNTGEREMVQGSASIERASMRARPRPRTCTGATPSASAPCTAETNS